MSFNDELNNYIKTFKCTAKDLSNASTLSPTLISRYINGKRTPRIDSWQLEKLADGLYEIGISRNYKINKKDILNTLKKSMSNNDINFDTFIDNFNILITELKINMSDFAYSLNYDTSFISRIKNGTRKPANLYDFIDNVSKYVVEHYTTQDKKKLITSLLNCSSNDIKDLNSYEKSISKWLCTSHTEKTSAIKNFLIKIDEFDLNNYITSDLSKVKIPTSPVILRSSKTFYGIEGTKQAEIEFLKSTLMAKSKEPVFIYSDMPMNEISSDDEFKKKWKVGLSMFIKKGLHLNIIHTVNRPIEEMLIGLEGWLPLYMAGSISPYYFENEPSSLFSYIHCTSGCAALSGECQKSRQKQSKLYVTTKKDEIIYYKEKSKYFLSKAKPLMTIYNKKNKQAFNEFISVKLSKGEKRYNFLSTIPLFTMSEELLNKILERNNITSETKKEIINNYLGQRKQAIKYIENNKIYETIKEISEEEFEKTPLTLGLSNMFLDKNIFYTFEEYKEHLAQLNRFVKAHKNYNLKIVKKSIFKNINIYINQGKCVIISKPIAPTMYFAISNSKLRDAIESFFNITNI